MFMICVLLGLILLSTGKLVRDSYYLNALKLFHFMNFNSFHLDLVLNPLNISENKVLLCYAYSDIRSEFKSRSWLKLF